MRKTLVVLTAVASLSLTASGALADDFAPPWWRNNLDAENNRSTYQVWEFLDSDIGDPVLGIEPDAYANPLYDPQTPANPPLGAVVAPIQPADWIPEEDGRLGVWPISGGTIAAQIPNYSDGPEKKILLQLTWRRVNPTEINLPLISAFGSAPGQPPIFASTIFSNDIDAGDNWFHTRMLLLMAPNPSFETIYISGDILVDQIVIDTICPEPGTLFVLGVGIPFILKARRRKRG